MRVGGIVYKKIGTGLLLLLCLFVPIAAEVPPLSSSSAVVMEAESGEVLADVLADVRAQAQRGVSAHQENTLYTQLAQSLVNWCALIEKTPNGDKPYARATMALLCRELRRALVSQ